MAQENQKQRRPANFTTEETDALREIVGNRRDFVNGIYIGDKKDLEKAWAQITLILFNTMKLGTYTLPTPQRLKDKWMRMQMKDKKDLQNEAATGDKSASAERDDIVEGYFYLENDSSSKMGIQKDSNKMAQENQKQRRPAKFTTEETDALRIIIGNRRDFVNGKYIGHKKDLEKAWAQITLLFNDMKLGMYTLSTSQRPMDKCMRMQMKDKKDVQNEAATGGDLTFESASAEIDDKMGQKGMSVVKESPGPGTNTDISATSQAPGKRIRTRSLTCSDGCSSQNWQDKEELEKRLSNFLVRKRSLKLKN
uniref:Myb/SANT-like DNA-binding domain-containing protein n=1 Tax=Magallana gigas TaxID=29159 RepID=A0A8W8IYJ2_MAGGI